MFASESGCFTSFTDVSVNPLSAAIDESVDITGPFTLERHILHAALSVVSALSSDMPFAESIMLTIESAGSRLEISVARELLSDVFFTDVAIVTIESAGFGFGDLRSW